MESGDRRCDGPCARGREEDTSSHFAVLLFTALTDLAHFLKYPNNSNGELCCVSAMALIRMHEATIPGLRVGGTHPANSSSDVANLNHDPLAYNVPHQVTGAEPNIREKQLASSPVPPSHLRTLRRKDITDLRGLICHTVE
jgi:hypothetical protein